MRKKTYGSAVVLGAVLTLGLVAGAHARSAETGRAGADPGVTRTSILLGGTAPLSGEASAAAGIARGAEAYFKYVNSRGGVFGRKIAYRYVDDGYDPGRTVQATRELVQQEKVFAIFNPIGTAHNLATRPFLNQLGVPQLFVASGFSAWGKEARRYPWTIGFIPSYVGEGLIYARHLIQTRPRAKIAIIYQDDEYGKDLISGFKRGLRGGARIVAQQSYDPTSADVQSQIAKLKSSGADTLMVFAFGKFAIQSLVYVKKLSWRPQIYVNAVAASTSVMLIAATSGQTEGVISIVFFKDPAGPDAARDPGLKLFRTIIKRYLRGASPKDGYLVAGMASAYTMVETLRKAGRNLTRKGVIAAASRLDIRSNPFVVKGIRIKTSSTDHFPIEQARLQRWRKGVWVPFGKLVSAPRG